MADQDRRNYLRFYPERPELAVFSTLVEDFERFEYERRFEFKEQKLGLVNDESYKGCSIVVLGDRENPYGRGQKIVIKVGPLDPIQAELQWVRELDERVYKLGVSFLDTKIY